MASSLQTSLIQEIGGPGSMFSPPPILNHLYSASSSKHSGTSPQFFTDIQDWIHRHGGYFHPHQELDYNEKFNGWMLVANEDIEQGTVLSKVPWDLLIGGYSRIQGISFPSDATADDFLPHITGYLDCESTLQLMHELELGDASNFGPYVQYLKDIPSSNLPSMWSEQGKDILMDLLGGLDAGDLPPIGPLDTVHNGWLGKCKGTNDGLEAASLLSRHGFWDTLMAPTLDWYTHRNGKYLNVQIQIVPGHYFEVTALRQISKGEALHRSLDLCALCNEEAVEGGYGTPELFRDYGFVESYPQRWTFKPNAVLLRHADFGQQSYAPEQITFELVPDNTQSGTIHVEWSKHIEFDDKGRNYVRRIFRQHLRKLYRFHNVQHDLDDSSSDLPETERLKLLDYYHTLRTALLFAIHSLENEGDETGTECHEHMSSNEGACEASHVDIYDWHYDDLKWEEDDLNYIFPTCSTTQLLDFQNYDVIEELQTNYQKLWFMGRERDDDVCMNLENTLQICSSYRPHYHEFFVHFPARFLDKIERVIFIGGGDSMLLHEVLKYPTLTKVVGLELDQQVTRKSFQHFQSQPHWDNEKVEWWYGDATKSLPLLPRDYWGSFDLVLVDLSETVMSFSVTKTMDIFSALSLLLKPEGIMIKNEPYLDQFSNFFDYSIHIFYGTPKICTQVLVMGSNQVDFLHHPTKDHHVERLLLEPLDDDETLRYKYMHDYRKTDARGQGKCDPKGSLVEHGGRAGLIEILEAEQVSLDFETDHVETILFQIAKDQGLNPLLPPMVDAKDVNTIMVMSEGYIAARSSLEHRHIAFDIHLWGAFAKMEDVRSALLHAVGAQRSSFYRVVAGGMHGTSTWESDQDTIGIRVKPSRNCDEQTPTQSTMDSNEAQQLALKEMLRQSVRFLPKKDAFNAIVLCGLEGAYECASSTFLATSTMDAQVNVRTLWTCPGLPSDYSTASVETIDEMFECEMDTLRAMVGFVQDGFQGEIDLIILDPSAPFGMGQILNSILSVKNNREALVADQNILLAVSPIRSEDGDNRKWRRHVLERYRKASHFFPVSRAEVVLSQSPLQAMSLDIAVVHDSQFFQHLKDVERSLQKSLVESVDANGSSAFDTVEAKTVAGGMHYYDAEYDVREFPRDAYDPSPALQQSSEQVALGRQGIFQFEILEEENADVMPSIEALNRALEETIKTVLGVSGASIRRWSTYGDVGEGVAVVVLFPSGSVVLVWDGRKHLDINLYTTDQSKATSDQFVESFATLTGLTKTLRDDQPRGPGRVVQFQEDLLPTL